VESPYIHYTFRLFFIPLLFSIYFYLFSLYV
jgi:hypothetical protein